MLLLIVAAVIIVLVIAVPAAASFYTEWLWFASIGQTGGCNPVPLPSKVEGSDLVLLTSDLTGGVHLFASGAHS